MTKETVIYTYLARGIIEANLDFAKDKKSLFSLVKFKHTIDLDNTYLFKDFISFLYKETDFSSILQDDDDAFILLLRDKKIYQTKAIISKISYECKTRFNISMDSVGITSSSINDSYKSIMDRLNKYFTMAKISDSNKLFYGTAEFDYYDTINSTKILQEIFIKSYNVSLNNMYEGVPIKHIARVNGFSNGIMQVKIKPENMPFFEREKITYIEHAMIPDIIKADILKTYKDRFILVLGNLHFLKSSPFERNNTRIKPPKNIHALITTKYKKIAEGNIVSISENSISIKAQQAHIENILNRDLSRKEMEIKFLLANNKNFLSPMSVKAYIFDIIGNEIVLNIYPNEINQNKIKTYISIQQEKLLTHLKRELKK